MNDLADSLRFEDLFKDFQPLPHQPLQKWALKSPEKEQDAGIPSLVEHTALYTGVSAKASVMESSSASATVNAPAFTSENSMAGISAASTVKLPANSLVGVAAVAALNPVRPPALQANRPIPSYPIAATVAVSAAGKSTFTTREDASPAVWGDFVFVAAFSLLLVSTIFLDRLAPFIWPLRLFLAFIYIFLIPGFCFTTALFPRKDDLDGLERLGLSLGLSVVLIPIQALVLNYLPFGLTLQSILIASLATTFLFMGIALVERFRIPADEVFVVEVRQRLQEGWRELPHADRLIYLILIPILLLTIGAAVWAINAPATKDQATEFYILGKDGLAQDYPRESRTGAPLTVTAGVANHEKDPQVFHIEVYNGDQLIGTAGPFTIKSSETLSTPLQFTPVQSGDNVPVDIFLYRGLDKQAYRSLQLWLKINP